MSTVSFCNQSTMCIRLTIILILLVMSVIGESSNSNPTDSSQNSTNVCLTPGCFKAAEEIASSLDQNVDPCDDFYEFACGGWKAKHEIEPDRPGIFVMSELRDKIDNMVKNILEQNVTGDDPSYVRKLKQIYQSCMDLESIEAVGGEPLKKALETLGGWPVVEGESWNGENFDWIDALILMRQMGYDHNILLGLSILPDPLNNTVPILTISETSMGLIDSNYLVRGLEDNVTAAYYRQMVQLAEKLGADHHDAETQMLDALNFQITLARHLLPTEERGSQEYNISETDQTLQEKVPQIDWMKYFNGLLIDPISEEDPIVILDPDFVENVLDLLNNTDKRVVANYMMWRVAKQTLQALSKEWLSLEQEFVSTLYEKEQDHRRDDVCLYSLAQYMSIGIGAFFVRNYFEEGSKQEVIEIVNYIQNEFANTFDNIQWMPQETRRFAKEKTNAMRKFVGYPKELVNDTIVSDLFKNLMDTDGNYYNNLMKLRKWKVDEDFLQLHRLILKGGWKEHAEVDMASSKHNHLENSIDLPAALLQNPYFDINRPRYLNFGEIGFIIGKEISRLFDDEGRQYDKNGNNVNWWDSETNQLFEEKMECLINQYSNYTTENGLKVDGALTLKTNIPDNAGLKAAYKAYQTWVADHGLEPQLPELNYSPNQLFWMAAATTRCAKFRAEYEEQAMLMYKISPFPFSIIGPMSNLPEFANDFQCEMNAKMNPQNKCQIWE